MKAHVAVDSCHMLIPMILASATNVPDALALPHLLRGEETCVRRDQPYQGHTATVRSVAPRARECTNRRYRFGGQINQAIKSKNRNMSRVRARVEHTIGVIKQVFGSQKVRYPGLAKNLH